MATLGDIAGAPTKLPYSTEYTVHALAGEGEPKGEGVLHRKTEEGREMIAVAVASEALMAKLEVNRAALAKLADPRTINMDDAQAEAITSTAAPIY